MNDQEKTSPRRARIFLFVAAPLVILGLIFGALYVTGETKSRKTPSGLKVNHKFHTDAGLSCDACHEQNPSNPRLVGFPNHENCAACHEDALDKASKKKNCALCHTQPDYKTALRKDKVLSPLVTFSHPVHEKAKVDCAQCHTVTDKDILTGDEMLPAMDTCVKCHTDRKVKGAGDCASCHVKGWEKLKPVSHDVEWKLSHGAGLTKDLIDDTCRACHKKELSNSCTKCHHQPPVTIGKAETCSRCHGEGFEKARPKDHTPLWVSQHGKGLTQTRIDARCALCHTPANGNDCQSCHKREAPKNHTTGWSLNLHGVASRSARQSCATCHDQAECISCHTTTPPFTHTGSWGTPYDRHCISCHAEGGSYVSGGIGGNCSVCHKNTDTFARHTSQPGHTTGLLCLACHGIGGIGPTVKHPYPAAAQCVSCHAFP